MKQCFVDKMVTVDRIPTSRTVHGFGRNDVDFKIRTQDGMLWQYDMWKSMLKRCFSQKFKLTRPNYSSVTCCDEWLSFATFLEWVNKEVGYKGKPVGFVLDKDLIGRGFEIYSPETCCLIPSHLNTRLVIASCKNGLPAGVSMHTQNGNYVAQIVVNGKGVHLGCFDDPTVAHKAYREAKENYVRTSISDSGFPVSQKAVDALLKWTF